MMDKKEILAEIASIKITIIQLTESKDTAALVLANNDLDYYQLLLRNS